MSAFKALKTGAFFSELTTGTKVLAVLGEAFPKLSGAITAAGAAATAAGGGFAGLAAGAGALLSAINPLILAFAGIAAFAGILDVLTLSSAEANKAMENSFSAYEQAQSDVESVNNELATTQARIDELNAKQSLTFVEQSELDKLQEANEKLQLQADLKKKQAEIAAKQAADDTITAYKKNYGKYNTSEERTSEYVQNADLTGNNAILFSNENDISAMIAGIRQMQKLRQEALNSNDSEEVASYDETIQGATESIWGQVIALEDYKSKLEAVTENGGTLSKEGQDALNSINDTIEYVYKQLKPEEWKQMQFDNIFNQSRFSDAKESLKELASETGNIGISAEQVASKYPGLVKEMEKAGYTAQDVANNINSELGLLNFDEVKKQLSEGFLPKGSDDDLGFQMLISKAQSEWDAFTKDMSQEDFEILYSIKQSNDTSGWDIAQWQKAFEDAKNTAQTSADAIGQSISEIINGETISKAVSEYTSKISTLKSAQEEYNKTGKLSASTTKDLYENISDASDYSDDLAGSLDDMIKAADTDVMAAFNDEIEKLQKAGDYSGADALRQYAQSVIESASEIEGAYQRIGKLKIETPQMQAVEEASNTDNGGDIYENMRSQYKTIKDLYKNGLTGTDDFKSFAAMISPTGSDDVANFEENMGKFERYFTESSKGCKNFLADLKALGYAEQDGSKWTYNLGNNMMELKAAAEQMGIGFEPFMAMFGRLEDYGAYNDFFVTEEQGTQHLSDLYGDLAKEKMRLAEIEANPNTSGYETARQESLDKIAEYEERIAKTKETINNLDATNAEYMKEKAEYSKNVAQSMLDEINATSDTTLKQSLIDQLDAFAEEYHLKINYDTGSITNLEEAVENIDFKVNLDATGSDLDEQISGLSSYLAQLREGGEVGLNTSKISDAEALLSYLVEKKQQLEQPAVMGIDSSQLDSANDKIASAITAIQNFQSAYNQLQEAQALGLDTSEAEANIQNAKSELDSIDESTQKVLNFEVNGDDDVESIIDKIQNLDLSALDTSVQNLSYHFEIDNQDELDAIVDKINNLPKDTQNVTVVLNTDQVDDTKLSSLTTALNSLPKGTESITVTLNMDEADTGKLETINSGLSKISQTHPNTTVVVNGGEAVTVIENIQNKLNAVDATHPNPTISASDQASSTISSVSSQLTNLNGKIAHTYVFTHHISSGKSEAQGNAKVHGNAKAQGNARAFGYKGEPKDTVALTGELKPELVVRGDEFFTVGDNGPEMVHLKKGDIVFDGDQTEDILTKGRTRRRGKAFARGNARVGGIDWSKSGNNGGTGSSSKPQSDNTKATNDNTSATQSNTEATKESTEAMNWVERGLTKLKTTLERYANQINDYISSSLKVSLLKKQLSTIDKQLEANQKGYDAYMEKANSINISDEYKDLVKNGAFRIEEIDTSTDAGKKLAEDIKQFQDYYDSAMDCKDAIIELNNKQLELYETLANMPTEKAEKKIEKLKRKYESLSAVSDATSSGGSVINALTKQINADNPKLANAQANVTKAETARANTKATRSTASKALTSAKEDTTESGASLSATAKKQTSSIAKNLKKAAKSSTDKATYNAIAKAIREGKPVSTKGLKGEALKYAKSYNSSLKQQNAIAKAIGSGKKVSTSGMSKVLKAEADQYNQDVKAQAIAQKAYDKAREADEKALEKLNKAKATKDEVYSQTSKEQQVLATNKSPKAYVVQNKLLDQELSILKAENKARQTALKEIAAETKKQQAEYDKAVASRDKNAKSLLGNKSVTSALNKTQLAALKAGKTVSTKGITDPAVLKKIEAYNKKVTSASDLNKKLNIQLEAQADAINAAAQAEAEYAQMLVENEKKKLENISNYYDSMMAQFENRNSLIQTYMNRMETRGYNLSTSFYEAQIANQKQIANKQKAELAAMQKSFQDALDNDRIQVGTQEYYEMQDAIQQVTMSIAETTNNIVELQASIRDLEWEQFDRLQESIKRVASESDFLIDLMSSKELYDKKTGQLTDEGMATMGLHGLNYNTYMAQADKYKEEMLKINAELANDPNNQKLIDRKNALIDAQQQAILAAENEKKAIRDMVEEGIDIELDAIDDLIDKYLDAIKQKKNLLEYEKKIQKQAESVASLQKQLAAYQNDNSEEAKAKIQEIKVNLKDAQDDLKESEYDKFISDQEELLERLRNDYEEVLNKRLDNIDVLIQTSIDQINANAENIQATLTEQATNVGYELSTEMKTIWEHTDGMKDVLSTYSEDFADKSTTFNDTLGDIYNRQKDMIDAIKEMADKYIQKVDEITQSPVISSLEEGTEKVKVETVDANDKNTLGGVTIGKVDKNDLNNTGGSGGATLSGSKTNTNTSNKNNTSSGGDGKAKVGDKVTFVSGKYYGASDGSSGSGNSNLNKSVYITRINSGSAYPYHISTGSKFGSGDLGWVKLNQLKGYASGGHVDKDQWAFVNENGQELIRYNGATLLPLPSGADIWNAPETKALLDKMSNPQPLYYDYTSQLLKSLQNVSGNGDGQNIEYHFDNVTLNLPNVKNYPEFMNAMVKDKKFERLINAMTIDKVHGGTKLSKHKISWTE